MKGNSGLDFRWEDGKCEEIILCPNGMERDRFLFHGSWPLKDNYT